LTGHADVKEVCADLSVLEERKECYSIFSQILEQWSITMVNVNMQTNAGK